MSEIEGIARIKIHPGKLEEYKRLAGLCMEVARTRDTGTLQYDLFLNADQTEVLVHERYRDSAALLEHLANLGPLMGEMMGVGSISGEVLGNPSPELRKGMEAAGVRIFSPFQSLARAK